MAKKKSAPRRVPRSTASRTYGDGRPSQTAAAVAGDVTPTRPETTVRPVPAPAVRRGLSALGGTARSQVPLSQEYGYVPKDLGRLAILAASTFVIMIILGILI
jgi:hypothetical protein